MLDTLNIISSMNQNWKNNCEVLIIIWQFLSNQEPKKKRPKNTKKQIGDLDEE